MVADETDHCGDKSGRPTALLGRELSKHSRVCVIPHERSECRDLLELAGDEPGVTRRRSRQALRACGMTAQALRMTASGLVAP
jgi:hypothetical protein